MSYLSQHSISKHCLVAIALVIGSSSTWAQWTQFGGPERNFRANTEGLADRWSEDGPAELWRRPLGTGYSGISVQDGTLYTMYRKSKEDPMEYTTAIDVESGKTLWEHGEEAPVPDSIRGVGLQYTGPNATPLVRQGRVFSVGRNGSLIAFEAKSGKPLWKQQLDVEFGAQTHECGFSSSPIGFEDLVILPIGQVQHDFFEGRSLLAFDQKTGEVAWASQSFLSWHSSPIFIERDGKQQLVACTNSSLIGVDPEDGSLLWEYVYPNPREYESIWASPVWDGKDTIFFSSQQSGFAVRLRDEDGKTHAELLWSNGGAPMGMGTPVWIDGLLIGAKRGQNASFMALDAETGERQWYERKFTGATIVGDRNKLVILDSAGELSLVTLTQEGLSIASQIQLTEQWSLTAPTLVGTTLFVRDEKDLILLDLSAEANPSEK